MSEYTEVDFDKALGMKDRKPRKTKTSLERANEKHHEADMPGDAYFKYILRHVLDRYNRGKD